MCVCVCVCVRAGWNLPTRDPNVQLISGLQTY